ncbi:MAG: ATPase, T2SS/T4P/T4SS family, partial [Deltaproteobacteria bacterium]
EDPVEYRLGSNIVQVQVHEKAGLTFASALRSILRQDPDVVLIGEIRDQETAEIAVQASLTGHLVLSTLHTNDAANAVTRLLDMGIEAYKIGSALRGIIAQRLMRRLCPACKEPDPEPVPERMARFIPAGTTVCRAVGCPECVMTGYKGRFSLVEVLVMTPELERLIGSGGTADRVAEFGRKNGMRSLWDSGLRHVLQGDTTIDELLRVTDVPVAPDVAPAPAAPRQGRATRASGPPAPPAPASAPPPAASPFGLAIDMELVDEGPTGGGADRGGERGIRVLLVDDEDDLRRVMRDLLEREGFAVLEARDGVQALDEVDRHAPDIVVLDLNLPGLDGYGVLSHLRSRPATRDIPVIVLTAKGDEENEVKVFEMGADDFLSKPFRARALAARLEAVLGRRGR